MPDYRPLPRDNFLPGAQSIPARVLNQIRDAIFQEIEGVTNQINVKKFGRRLTIGLSDQITGGGGRSKRINGNVVQNTTQSYVLSNPVKLGTFGLTFVRAPASFVFSLLPGNQWVFASVLIRSFTSGYVPRDIWAGIARGEGEVSFGKGDMPADRRIISHFPSGHGPNSLVSHQVTYSAPVFVDPFGGSFPTTKNFTGLNYLYLYSRASSLSADDPNFSDPSVDGLQYQIYPLMAASFPF